MRPGALCGSSALSERGRLWVPGLAAVVGDVAGMSIRGDGFFMGGEGAGVGAGFAA